MSAFGPVASALPLEGLVEEVRRQGKETSQTIVWSGRGADAEFDDVLIYLDLLIPEGDQFGVSTF